MTGSDRDQLADICDEVLRLPRVDPRISRAQALAQRVTDDGDRIVRVICRKLAMVLCDLASEHEDVLPLANKAALFVLRGDVASSRRIRKGRPPTAGGKAMAEIWAHFSPSEKEAFLATVKVTRQTVTSYWLKGYSPKPVLRPRIAQFGIRVELWDMPASPAVSAA